MGQTKGLRRSRNPCQRNPFVGPVELDVVSTRSGDIDGNESAGRDDYRYADSLGFRQLSEEIGEGTNTRCAFRSCGWCDVSHIAPPLVMAVIPCNDIISLKYELKYCLYIFNLVHVIIIYKK